MAGKMKYCRKCGMRSPTEAIFCPTCGTEFMKTSDPDRSRVRPIKYCRSCGKENAAEAKFCRYCGYHFTVAAGGGVKTQKHEAFKTEKKVRQAHPAASGKDSRKRILAGVLIAAIFVVTAFKYPGFLVKKGRPEDIGSTYQTTGKKTGKDAGGDSVSANGAGDGMVYDDLADPMALSAGEIPLRYTSAQLEEAPLQSADVIPNQGSVVLGEVSVDIPSWELEAAGDRIEVRDLPKLTQGKDGWSIKAYDFSLASGTHEFDSDIRITIPRGNDGSTGCVWYNAETGRWEDIYSEVSEDGKNYIIYTDHFSLFGKKYIFDEKRLDLIVDDGRRIDLKHGIFIENRHKNRRMEESVRIDYERMWNLFQNRTLEDVKDLHRSMALLTKTARDRSAMTEEGYHPAADILAEAVGDYGIAEGAFQVNAGLRYDKVPSTNKAAAAAKKVPETKLWPEQIGQVMTMLDVILTGYKIRAEALDKTTNSYSQALWDTVKEHKLDLFSTSTGVVGTFTPEVLNPVMAVIGLALTAYSIKYNEYITEGVDEWYKQYYPDEGEVYRRFYQDAGVTLYYDSEEFRKAAQDDYHVALMEKPVNMDDKRFKEFSSFINSKKGLRTDTYKGFAAAFSKLMELYADQPEQLETIFDDFYRSVAGAFWKLPVKETQGARGQGPRYKFLDEYKYLGKDPYNLQASKQIRISDSYIKKLRVDTVGILDNVTYRYQRKACDVVMQKMEKEVLPILNRTLVFHVIDEAVGSGKTFADSVYCVDWQSINSNRKYRSLPDGESIFDDKFKTPMWFEGADGPVFLPIDSDGGENSVRNYWPYTPGFLPQANKKSDIVFRCTYYHYMMMGAPKKMVFKDLNSGKEIKADIEIPEIDPKDGNRVTDVYITVNGKKEIPQLQLMLEYLHIDGSPENNLVEVFPNGEVRFTLAPLDDYRNGLSFDTYSIYNYPALTFNGRVVTCTAFDDPNRAPGDDPPEVTKENWYIIEGYLTGSPSPFSHDITKYWNGEYDGKDGYKVNRISIAPKRNDTYVDTFGDYSTFSIERSRKTGNVRVTIRIRGDVYYWSYGKELKETLYYDIDLGKLDPINLTNIEDPVVSKIGS